jgi:hypothetical protein
LSLVPVTLPVSLLVLIAMLLGSAR